MKRMYRQRLHVGLVIMLFAGAVYPEAWSEAAEQPREELVGGETNEAHTTEDRGNAADPKDPTIGKITPLHKAVRSGNLDDVRTLLDQGAQVNAAIAKRTVLWHRLETPLETAIRNRHIEIAKLLVERGANVNARTANGETLLHLAARLNDPALVRLLLDGGAHSNRTNRGGLTAKHVAQKLDGKSGKRKEVIALLKQADARALQDEPFTVPVAPPSAPPE